MERPLRAVAELCVRTGYAPSSISGLGGRTLGEAVARALIGFEAAVGVPTRLADVPGFTDAHIARALAAAKDPVLKMKLENMPVPLTAEMVDDFMGPVLQSAKTGDLGLIRNT